MRRHIVGILSLLLGLLWLADGAAAGELPVTQILDHIRRYALTPPDAVVLQTDAQAPHLRTAQGINAFLRHFDSYARWISSEELKETRRIQESAPCGVGMDLVRDKQGRVICIPYTDSPAQKAGLRYGDELTAVDGRQLHGKSLEEAALLVRGPEGGSVELTLLRPGRPQPEHIRVVRSRVSPPLISRIDNGSVVGLRIYQFTPAVYARLRTHVAELQKALPQKLILDLRGNTGGDLESAVACAELFLPRGVVSMHCRGRDGAKERRVERNGPASLWPCEIIIRQDGLTASAAEVFIAALSFADRAEIRGSVSAGKAAVQQLFPLDDGSLLKLTTEHLLFPGLPFGWQESGLRPDEFTTLDP